VCHLGWDVTVVASIAVVSGVLLLSYFIRRSRKNLKGTITCSYHLCKVGGLNVFLELHRIYIYITFKSKRFLSFLNPYKCF
jgi:hypothetical protein